MPRLKKERPMQSEESQFQAPDPSPLVDVVIVGAGLGGLYATYKCRSLGYSVQTFETAPDVGGTWYWNRYPGARCDVESLEYSYSFSAELLKEWVWTERYATQPEILRYLNHVAERFDLRGLIAFNSTIISARFDEAANVWSLETQDGQRIAARYVITAVGCLSIAKPPEFEGLEHFAGEWRQTSAWRDADLKGKRVGIIGTGSSGIQAIPKIAAQAAHLTVFQRTPNFSLPAKNGPVDPAHDATVKADYPDYLRRALQTSQGIIPKFTATKEAFAVSDQERAEIYEAGWARAEQSVLGAFTDITVNLAANDTAADFVRGKIRSIVKDPAVAEKLCPIDHPIGTKRICLDSDYFATFNRPNVTLVDLRETPIERVTRDGVKTSEGECPLDVLIFATGFDAVTGALLNMNIEGIGGRRLRDDWADGPRSYLGLMTAGYPNLFTVTGPSSPSVLANMVRCVEQHVDWIAGCLEYMRRNKLELIEASAQAQEAWAEEVHRGADGTLFPRAKSWYLGDNVDGKPRVFLAYVGGLRSYVERCEEIVRAGYEGFQLSTPPSAS
jgi:cyclohexanone monooxygenase